MHKLIENAKKELKKIEDNGLNTSNIDNAYKLASITKNLMKLEEKEGENEMRGGYMEGYQGYQGRGGYQDGGYRDGGYGAYNDGGYGRRGVPGSGRGRGRYSYGAEDRWREHLERVMDGADMYEYGRSRYRDGGDKERLQDGIEKLMYALCMFIESTIDFAETPEEKEIIRKHIQKIKNV